MDRYSESTINGESVHVLNCISETDSNVATFTPYNKD